MADKKPKRPRDPNQLAKLMVDIASGEESENTEETVAEVSGRKGGAARASNLTPERRKEIAKKAAAKRWGNKEG